MIYDDSILCARKAFTIISASTNAARGYQLNSLRRRLRYLYFGHDGRARVFRFALLAFDIISILFFIGSSLIRDQPWIYLIDVVVAGVIAADFLARLWISNNRRRFFTQLTNWADLVVIVTLIAPAFIESFLFLRVLRALRLLRSYHMLRDLRRDHKFFREHEEIIQSVVNLMVFIFMMTALVYVFQVRTNPQIKTYIDALYFTIATLTTTGFGDVTLTGTTGRMLAIAIMLVGVALFLRLVQTIFRPAKVKYTCPDCGLSRHDPDAIHCKHCGRTIKIATEGADV